MKTQTLFGLAAGFTSVIAQANSVSVQTFAPSSGHTYVFSETGRPYFPSSIDGTQNYRRYVLGLNYNYLDNPLVELSADRLARTDSLISNVQTLDLLAGIEFNGKFAINVSAPFNRVTTPSAGGQLAVGDFRIFPKLYLSDRSSATQFALIPELRLPTGDSALLASNGGPTFGISAALEHDFGGFTLTANAGYRAAPNALFRDVDYRQSLPVSLGAYIPFAPRWAFNVEGAAAVLVPFNQYQNPSDLYAGLNWRISDELVATGGGAVSTFNTIASGNYRIAFGLRFTPFSMDNAGPTLPATVTRAQPKAEDMGELPAPPTAPIVDSVKSSKAAVKPAAKPSTRVIYNNRWIYVRDEIVFEHDSNRLLPISKNILDEVAQVLKENRRHYKSIVIEGHTNELGRDEYNLALSQKRAKAVKAYLISRGIDGNTLKTVGYGKRRPKITARMGVSRDTRLVLNRRVHFVVTH